MPAVHRRPRNLHLAVVLLCLAAMLTTAVAALWVALTGQMTGGSARTLITVFGVSAVVMAAADLRFRGEGRG